jgi:hypothetical protein
MFKIDSFIEIQVIGALLLLAFSPGFILLVPAFGRQHGPFKFLGSITEKGARAIVILIAAFCIGIAGNRLIDDSLGSLDIEGQEPYEKSYSELTQGTSSPKSVKLAEFQVAGANEYAQGWLERHKSFMRVLRGASVSCLIFLLCMSIYRVWQWRWPRLVEPRYSPGNFLLASLLFLVFASAYRSESTHYYRRVCELATGVPACKFVAPSGEIQLETVNPPIPLLLDGGRDDRSEASAVAVLEGGLLLVANDKSKNLLVVDVNGREQTELSSVAFKHDEPKWEALARDDQGNFYISGSHNAGKGAGSDERLAARSTLLRFRIRGVAPGPFAIEDVVPLDIAEALSALGLSRDAANPDAVKIEGLAVRVLKDAEGRVRRELVIGLREPHTPIRALVADITSLPERPTGESPIRLHLKTLFTFNAGSRQDVDFSLASLEYLPEWKGFLVVTSSEDDNNCFHGNILWFLPDEEVSTEQPANARRLWLFGLEPEAGIFPARGCDGHSVSLEAKAEGIAVLEADSGGPEGYGRARLVLVYDNDAEKTGKPSLLQTLRLVRWRD